jgi:predicted O-methyltransferase YrrM
MTKNINEKIKKFGIIQTIDDLLGNNLSYAKYLFCKLTGKHYFGAYLASTQGKIVRHHYITQLVNYYLRYNKGKILLIEIGSWAGGSAITWAKAIKNSDAEASIICIDPWIDYINDAKNKDWTHKTMKKALLKKKIYKLFLHNVITSGCSDMISILQGTSEGMLPYVRDNVADIIFIDGDHSYDSVLRDIQLSAPLLKNGGIICGDDLELQYYEVDQITIRKFKDYDVIQDPFTKKRYHPGVSMAVYDFFKMEISSWEGLWAMQKYQNQFCKISLSCDNIKVDIPCHLR